MTTALHFPVQPIQKLKTFTTAAPTIPSAYTFVQDELCIVMTLPPGDYTARVYGKNSVTGVGRVGITKIE